MGKGPFILGGVALALGGALLWAKRTAAQPAPVRSLVQTFLKVRRGVREKWRGALYPPPANLDPRPKFKPGQQVTINDKDAAPGDPTQGKTVTVKEMIYYEPVTYGTDAAGQVTVTPLPERGTWSYATDLTLDGQTVLVAETSLYSK